MPVARVCIVFCVFHIILPACETGCCADAVNLRILRFPYSNVQISEADWPPPCRPGVYDHLFCAGQDIEAWAPPIPPGKVLLESLVASATVLFRDGYSDSGESGAELGTGEERGMAASHAADVISRGWVD